MEFCAFHQDNCDDEKMITIIELKRGKITQTKICQECFSKRVVFEQLANEVPQGPDELLDVLLRDKSYDQDCVRCIMLNNEENKMSSEQKIKILESKIAVAVKVEDYETAAAIKKEIDRIKSLS